MFFASTPLTILLSVLFFTLLASQTTIATDVVGGKQYYVSPDGINSNPGTADQPLRTISAAAKLAMPGDTVTVRGGVYRERINPPRGGTSDSRRITYQAAPGEQVVVKGSEVITGWKKLEHDTWQVTIDNQLFGDFNPYADVIHGDWFKPFGRTHHTGAVYLNAHWLNEAKSLDEVQAPAGGISLWFAKVEADATTLWAQFPGVDPNEAEVEINVRQAVFYPEEPGNNYITVRGFTLEQAATPWAPPTAEQIGLIGTHWSKGWVIENNTIRYSKCVGITLGKHGDKFDNTSANSAEGYVETIERGIKRGWSKQNIGSHVVRNNRISHCEQAGIVGSLGAIFSTVTGNTIHDINFRKLFGGAEMAGIKFHGAIDTEISHNRIYRCGGFGGIWLDWMTQGTRVTRNLLYENHRQDLFVEVNHGPYLVDHNIFLSPHFLSDWSQGGAFVHNLAVGTIKVRPQGRRTPYFEPHSTKLVGLESIPCGDTRYFNNLFLTGPDVLSEYDRFSDSMQIAGNVYAAESHYELINKSDGTYLKLSPEPSLLNTPTQPVTTKLLGTARVPQMRFVQPDDSAYRLDTDYLGRKRTADKPSAGPFEMRENVTFMMKVW